MLDLSLLFSASTPPIFMVGGRLWEALPVCHPSAVGITARALGSSPGLGGAVNHEGARRGHEGFPPSAGAGCAGLWAAARPKPEAGKKPECRDRNHSGTSPSSPPLGTIPEAAEPVIQSPLSTSVRTLTLRAARARCAGPSPQYALFLDSGPSCPVGPFRPSRCQPSTPASAHRERLRPLGEGPDGSGTVR